VVHQLEQIELLEAAFADRKPFPLWLKVDTGMNRLGFRPQDFRAAWERLRNLQAGTAAAAGNDAPGLRR
jgi:alanine racemase